MINYLYSQKLKFEQLFVDIPLTHVDPNSPSPSIIRAQYVKYLGGVWYMFSNNNF